MFVFVYEKFVEMPIKENVSPADLAILFAKFQSDRVSKEIIEIQSRPVDGIHYETITTCEDKGRKRNVMEFAVKKYDAQLDVILPDKYPYSPPEVRFNGRKQIPLHSMVDEKSGVVRGLWTEQGQWKSGTMIRDLCEEVMKMLAVANTPLATPPKPNVLGDEELRFSTTMDEFKFFCSCGPEFVQELRDRYRCMIKFHFKKNRPEGPHLLIKSKEKTTRLTVATALDQFLVCQRVRRSPKFKEPDPEPNAQAFVSFYQQPPTVIDEGEDLIQFGEDEKTEVEAGTVESEETREEYPGSTIVTGEYTEDEMIQLSEKYSEAFMKLKCLQSVAMSSVKHSMDKISSPMGKAEATVANAQEMIGNMHSTIAALRRQMESQIGAGPSVDTSRFKCPRCARNQMEIRLECGHVFCQECIEGTFCVRCRQSGDSILNLFV